MQLSDLGWTPFYADAFRALTDETLIPARIFRQDKQRYLLHDGTTFRNASLLGKLVFDADDRASLPAVGDWVAAQPFDDEAIVHAMLPRSSAFYRKEVGEVTRRQIIAANIDTVFLVSGLDNDFNVRRIERYVVQAAGSGATPVILLNKTDLCEDLDAVVASVRIVAPDIDILPISAVQDIRMDGLEAYISPGRTVAFLGSSGVGKSSLVNRLLGADQLKTGTVREDDSRGRHTTTHRELMLLPQGGLVMDTPGLRELQLWADEEDLQAVFADIELLGEGCRFRDCEHLTEPGCAVQAAIDQETLDADRFQSYQKLRREIAYLNQRQDEAAQQKARKREKDFGKMMKAMKKHNPKR